MRIALSSLLAFALAVATFSGALSAELLHFDDDLALTLNPFFRGLDGERLAWMLGASRLGHYQPLTWFSYALDFELAGLDARAFHRTNVLLHGLTAALFVPLAARLFRAAAPAASEARLATAALFAALLFAVHPLRAESVAWVTERRDVLSGLFFVATLAAWMRWAPGRSAELDPRRAGWAALACAACVVLFLTSVERAQGGALALRGLGAAGVVLASACLGGAVLALARGRAGAVWFALAVMGLLLSLSAKAWGIVLPAVLLVLDAWPLKRLDRGTWKGLLVEKLPFATLAVPFALLAGWAQSSQGGTMRTLAQHSLLERGLQAGYGLCWYPLRTLLPLDLSPIYELPRELSAADPRFLAPALAALAVTLVLVACRRRAPAALAAWVAFAAIVSPVLGLAQSGPQLVADRYSYLSCLPFALLAAGAWLRWPTRALGSVLLTLAILALALLARRQVAHWRNDAALWEHALAVQSESHVVLYQLGTERERQGRLDEAQELLERGFALEDDPRFLTALSRVSASRAEANPAEAERHRQAALAYSRRALTLAQDTDRFVPELRLTYGTDLWNAGQLQEALVHFEWYVSVVPSSFQGRLNLGIALSTLGRRAEAVEHLQAAVQLEPENPAARAALDSARSAGN